MRHRLKRLTNAAGLSCARTLIKNGCIGPTNSRQTHNSVIFIVSGYHGHKTNHGVADFAKKRELRDTNEWHSAKMRDR